MTGKKNQPKKALTHLLTAEIISTCLHFLREERRTNEIPFERPFRVYLPFDPSYETLGLIQAAAKDISMAGTRYGEPYGKIFQTIARRIDFESSELHSDRLVINMVFR